jgi:hypothetical protein
MIGRDSEVTRSHAAADAVIVAAQGYRDVADTAAVWSFGGEVVR